MDMNNIRAFIKYGIDEKMTHDKVMTGSIAISLLAAAIGCMGIYSKVFVSSILIFIIGIIYIIFASALSQNITHNKRVKCTALNTVAVSAMFSLCCQVFVEINSIRYGILLTLSPLALGALSFFVALLKCKMNMYIDKRNNPAFMNLAPFAALGVGLSGILLDELPFFENTSVETTLAICFCLISNAFVLLGAPSLLKVYYIKKFNI